MNRPLRVVVADDERDIRDYLQKALPRLGYEVVAVACDGPELVEQCRAVCPDVVLTDVRMPGLTGVQAATKICEERPVPVILMSARFEDELTRCAEADHVMGYLGKPLARASLKPTIDLAVQRFGQRQEHAQPAAAPVMQAE